MDTYTGGRVTAFCGECGYFHTGATLTTPDCADWKAQADRKQNARLMVDALESRKCSHTDFEVEHLIRNGACAYCDRSTRSLADRYGVTA